MPKQSVLSKTIDTSNQEAQYDASVKRLLSQKIVLAWMQTRLLEKELDMVDNRLVVK